MRGRWLVALAAAPAILSAPLAHAENGDEQQFLFLLDPAYVQEAGEWQAGAVLHVPQDDDVDFTLESEFEYGLTDRLQMQASFPYTQGDGFDGFGDLSIGFTYGVLLESVEAPAFSVAVAAIAPTGDSEDGLGADAWGYGVSAALSKQVLDGVWVHANAEYERTDGARVDGDEADVSEWLLGAGAAFQLGERSALTLELARERERVESALAQESDYETAAAFGLLFSPVEELELGAAAHAVLAGDDDDAGLTLKALFEW